MSIENPPEKSNPNVSAKAEEIKARLNELTKKSSDMELVSFLSEHIDKPCEVEVSLGEVRNIREFYINIAKDSLKKLTNPFAKELLEKKIEEYNKK